MSQLPKEFTAKVKDWQVCPVAQVGGAAVIGAGAYMVMFKSPSLGVSEAFSFIGAGLGAGGSLGGTTLDGSYSKIDCSKEFSLSDLHLCIGRIGSATASFGAGASAVSITAYPVTSFSYLFEECIVPGWSAGVGLGATYFTGVWFSLKLRPSSKEESSVAYRNSYSITETS